MKPIPVVACVVAMLCAGPLWADECDGDPGYVLTATPNVAGLGDPVEINLSGPGLDTLFLLISDGPGPSPSPVGPLCVNMPPIRLFSFGMPAAGHLTIPTYTHCVPALDGFTFYFQFVSVATDGSGRRGRSNLETVTGMDNGNGCNFCVGNAKGTLLRMRYTGDSCAASSHSQDPGSVTCSGDPAFAPVVRLVVQDKDLGDGSPEVYFDGTVTLGGIFDIDSTVIGRTRLKGETWIIALDQNDNVIHTVSFHTSCSQPLHGFDQYGAFQLLAFIAE